MIEDNDIAIDDFIEKLDVLIESVDKEIINLNFRIVIDSLFILFLSAFLFSPIIILFVKIFQ